MKKRFVGPPNPGPGGQELGHDVVVAGRALGTVKPGEVLDVPDDVAARAAWPGQLWEDAKTSPKKSEGES